MRVRFEMYENGYGTGYQCKCDLTQKKANKIFNELKQNAKCGWVELIDKDMNIVAEHEQIKLAQIISRHTR